MEDYFDWEKAKAFVYLLADGDDDNKVAISDEMLLVTHKTKKRLFPINQIVQLKVEYKKMLFPLIMGGIITPFAFLSYFTNLFSPWIHLVSMLSGMYFFYLGWSGKSSFTIVLKNSSEDNFYLPSISRNLWAFIDFVNSIIADTSSSGLKAYLFFEIEQEHADSFFDISSKAENISIFPVLGSTYSQWKKDKRRIKEENLIVIDPLLTGTEIHFSFDEKTKQMRPQLDRPVPKSSKVDSSDFH